MLGAIQYGGEGVRGRGVINSLSFDSNLVPKPKACRGDRGVSFILKLDCVEGIGGGGGDGL